MQIRLLLLLAATAILGGCVIPPAQNADRSIPGADTAESRTTSYFDHIRDEPVMLNMFLRGMPKGADLHNHLSGAVPTETLIHYAVEDRLCIDTTTFTATPPPAVTGGSCPTGQRPAAESQTDAAFFTKIVRAWSMQGFQPGAESSHDHFFATFGKFGLATSRKGDMLAGIAPRSPRAAKAPCVPLAAMAQSLCTQLPFVSSRLGVCI